MCVAVDELSKYLYYVRRLDFFETPDYDYLRQLFSSVLTNSGSECDWDFDWIDRQLVSFRFLLYILHCYQLLTQRCDWL